MRRRSGESGFTMVEMSVTLAIIGVLAVIAVPSFINLMPRFRLGNAAQTLANELAMARMTAIAKSVDAEAVFDPAADSYALRKSVGGAGYGGQQFGGFADLESLTYLDGSAAPNSVQLHANGATSVPLQEQALAITLQTKDGAHKRRVLVWVTGRIHSQKLALDGATWVED